MMLYVYIHSLTGKIYKILPLKEEQDRGVEVHLRDYLEGLLRDVLGAFDTFPELRQVQEYITVVNVLQFLCHNDFDQGVCKSDIFKMLKLLNQIERQIGGVEDA